MDTMGGNLKQYVWDWIDKSWYIFNLLSAKGVLVLFVRIWSLWQSQQWPGLGSISFRYRYLASYISGPYLHWDICSEISGRL